MIPALGLYDYSSKESERIVRLPLFNGLAEKEVEWDGKGDNNYFFKNK